MYISNSFTVLFFCTLQTRGEKKRESEEYMEYKIWKDFIMFFSALLRIIFHIFLVLETPHTRSSIQLHWKCIYWLVSSVFERGCYRSVLYVYIRIYSSCTRDVITCFWHISIQKIMQRVRLGCVFTQMVDNFLCVHNM